MAIPKFIDDLNIIAKLGDRPSADNNLSSDAFKRKFDEGILIIQNYINNVLIPGIENSVSEDGLLSQVGAALKGKLDVDGGTMRGPLNMDGEILKGIAYPTGDDHAVNRAYVTTTTKNAVLRADSWSATAPYTQTVTVEGLTDNLKATAYPEAPDNAENAEALADELVKVFDCKRTGNKMTFRCLTDKPSMDIAVIVEVYV